MKIRRDRSGFSFRRWGMTLLEVLMISGLLSVVTVLTLHLLVNGSRYTHKRIEQVRQVRQLNAALEELITRLEMALPVHADGASSALTLESQSFTEEGFQRSEAFLSYLVPVQDQNGIGIRKEVCRVGIEKVDGQSHFRLLCGESEKPSDSLRPILSLSEGETLSFVVRVAGEPNGPWLETWGPNDPPPGFIRIELTTRRHLDRRDPPEIVSLSRTISLLAEASGNEGSGS